MANDTKQTNEPAKEPKAVAELKDSIAKKFSERYAALNTALNKEINIGTRYEIKIRMEELQNIFEIITK